MFHTPDQIQSARVDFKEQGWAEESTTYNGKKKVPYFVIPADHTPISLPHKVFSIIGENPDDGAIFAVSETLREDFRGLAIGHEYHEFMKVGADTEGRCAEASVWEIGRAEIEIADQDDLAQYIKLRRDYFSNLINYLASNPLFPDEIEEYKASLRAFEEETKKYE